MIGANSGFIIVSNCIKVSLSMVSPFSSLFCKGHGRYNKQSDVPVLWIACGLLERGRSQPTISTC